MKRILAIFIILFTLLVPVRAFSLAYGLSEYGISSYDVHVKVGSDNVYEVTETIVADFFVEKHGIYRKIPTRYEGQKVRISDIYVSEQFSKRQQGGYMMLKIGDPDVTLTGKKEYTIRYTFDMGRDSNDGFDLFYFNIIGGGWDTMIRNITFTLELPDFFEKDAVSFYSGPHGSTAKANLYYETMGMKITGSMDALSAYNGLTAHVVLPESAFAGESSNNDHVFYSMAAWAACIFLILFSWFIWNSKGRDDLLHPSVQFRPPEGMTPAEVGYVIDGVVDNRDVTALIFYWADRGYLEVTESGKNEFLFVKIKEPETSNDYETFMFHRLFEYGHDGWVSTNDLKHEFYEDIPLIKTQIKGKYEKGKVLFTSESTAWSNILQLLSVLPSLILVVSIIGFSMVLEALIPIVFMIVGVLVVGAAVKQVIRKWNVFTRGGKILRILMFSLLLLISFFIFFVFSYALGENYSYAFHSDVFLAAEALRTAAATFAMYILAAVTIKRTEFGHRSLEKLVGLKNFINEAEMDKLRQMIDDNPSYFYNILPYAMVLGLENKWAGKMEGITMAPPNYYRTQSGAPMRADFITVSLMRCIARTTFATTVGKSSGSGGVSGGGFSGGGVGGGGGGSW